MSYRFVVACETLTQCAVCCCLDADMAQWLLLQLLGQWLTREGLCFPTVQGVQLRQPSSLFGVWGLTASLYSVGSLACVCDMTV